MNPRGFPGGASGKELTCQCRGPNRCWFDPWVGKIPWRRAWQPTPVFLTGECHGQSSLVGYIVHPGAESDMTEETEHCAQLESQAGQSCLCYESVAGSEGVDGCWWTPRALTL